MLFSVVWWTPRLTLPHLQRDILQSDTSLIKSPSHHAHCQIDFFSVEVHVLFYCIIPQSVRVVMLAILTYQRKAIKVLPLSERGKVLNKERKKKEYAEVAKIWGKDKSSISEIGKKEKTCKLVLLVNFKVQKLGPQQVISA